MAPLFNIPEGPEPETMEERYIREEWQSSCDNFRPRPKPPKPYRASAKDWEKIREYLLPDICWVCGVEQATELHHLLPRDGAGTWPRGDDIGVNLIPLDSECHRKIEARDPEARAALRGALMPSNLHYLVFRLGGKDRAETFLERHYAR